MTPEERVMEQRHERLQKLAASNAPFGTRGNAEKLYGESYQALVRTGQRRQLRGKYRGH